MSSFTGFHARDGTIRVPNAFFLQVVPQIRSLTELKVTLHLMWTLANRSGSPRCIEYSELAHDSDLIRSVKWQDGPRPGEDYLREGLELAMTRGTVRQVNLHRSGAIEAWYFLNSPTSRDWIQKVEKGNLDTLETAFGEGGEVEAVQIPRPNVFALYEQNIGALTPIMAERLRAAESEYPSDWLEEAVSLAVEYNKRNWRYIETILKRWETEGKDDGLSRRRAEEETDPYGYYRSKYQHLYN